MKELVDLELWLERYGFYKYYVLSANQGVQTVNCQNFELVDTRHAWSESSDFNCFVFHLE